MSSQQQETTVMTLSVRELEDAANLILSNNFDADSRVCLITLIKMLDNIIQKPQEPKVRTIRLENKAFDAKIGQRRGGIEFLHACGFQQQQSPPAIAQPEGSGERLLVLSPVNEKQSHLLAARRLLQTRAVQDLQVSANDLPVFKAPPPPVVASASASAAASTSNFNVYAGHRFDVQSAAAGANLGPDAGYVSKTDVQLDKLQKQQQALQKKLHQPLATSKDRQWKAWDANSNSQPQVVAVAASSSGATMGGSSDSTLLAQRMQKQQQERQKREEGGFTTAAMRQVERLKKQKVYSHVQLTIQFADGVKLTGKFVPSETLQTVRECLIQECLIESKTTTVPKFDFDLYVTPPRRVLDAKKTLEQEGLAPAAKIFCSFKNYPKPNANATIGGRFMLRPELFEDAVSATASTTAAAATATAFPTAKPIAPSKSDASTTSSMQDSKPSAKPKKKVSREDALLKRMMGRK